MKKVLKFGCLGFIGLFVLIVAIALFTGDDSKETANTTVEKKDSKREEILAELKEYPIQEIKCEDVSLEEDITCIFNQAFTNLKAGENAVYEHYFVEKYQQTSIKVRVKNDIDKVVIFEHFKNAMHSAAKENDLKELTVDFYNEEDELVDAYSFTGNNDLRNYDWDTIRWDEVSKLASSN
ncbi:hypothetical protein LIS77_06715 [Cytobacillus firmus]|uniref:hypothetical protein n=1 Tax=Cytobacillus firmus TaxID=1399 RepID=UPI00207AB763|nr:hypothetical protein [Cytobacillus firmus]USK40184.1 hypothetical protein LIS77_06715 [Cytobacillus firmus]